MGSRRGALPSEGEIGAANLKFEGSWFLVFSPVQKRKPFVTLDEPKPTPSRSFTTEER